MCSSSDSVEVSPSGGLVWLRVGIYPLSTALSLIRAHAATLEELQLVAGCENPYGCPDLPAQLVGCGFAKLQRLVLLRESPFGFCDYSEEKCKKQRTALWEAFLAAPGNKVLTVLCSYCHKDKL